MNPRGSSPPKAPDVQRAGAVVIDASEVRFDAAVRLEGGRVASIEPAVGLTNGERETVLAPGLVNAHAHLDLGIAAAGARGETFLEWVAAVMEARGGRSPAEVAEGARAAADRLLETGTTTVLDIDASGVAGMGLSDSPIRLVSLREVIDGSPAEGNERTEAALALAREAVAAPVSERRASGLSPHGVHTVSDVLLGDLAPLARDVPVATHWAETPEETRWLLEGSGPFADWLGPSPRSSGAERLRRAGLLDGTLLVHGNCPAPGELALLAGRGVAVVHCPGSHLFFSRPGFALGDLRAAGIAVALGTDSAASNGDLDMRREMRLARETLGVSGAEAWRMATEEGARFAPWAHVTGRLGVGDAGDLVRLRPAQGVAAARRDGDRLLDLLTLSEPAVEEVWVAGERIEG
ncbi:MAG: amidohydrolase family protein [Planctomycetes bacterium]|nr:amidohydrolase family protein [Planctomycetota bacterium]